MLRSALVWWAAAAVVAVAAVLVLTNVLGGEESLPGGSGEAPPSAAEFADSVGVNVHLTYTDTPYADFGRVLSSLQDLGVRHVRDGLVPDRPDQYERLNRLAAAGIHTALIIGPPRMTRVADLLRTVRERLPRAVDAIEGPNEYDLSDDPDWANALRSYQRQLYSAVKADPVLRDKPVYGPTIVEAPNRGLLRELRQAQDTANIHPYPGGGPPEPATGREVVIIKDLTRKSSIVATETGYHNALNADQGQPAVDEATAADYLPRLFLGAFADGVRRTYWYELVDEFADEGRSNAEANFGLLRRDFTPKPAFVALRNLLRVVDGSENRRAQARALDVSISASPKDVRRLLLQKGDGRYVLALWREAALSDAIRRTLDDRPLEVRVGLPRRATSVAVYRPSRGAGSTARLRGVDEVSVPLAGDAVLVDLDFTGG